jgi:hypothetical protein
MNLGPRIDRKLIAGLDPNGIWLPINDRMTNVYSIRYRLTAFALSSRNYVAIPLVPMTKGTRIQLSIGVSQSDSVMRPGPSARRTFHGV